MAQLFGGQGHAALDMVLLTLVEASCGVRHQRYQGLSGGKGRLEAYPTEQTGGLEAYPTLEPGPVMTAARHPIGPEPGSARGLSAVELILF